MIFNKKMGKTQRKLTNSTFNKTIFHTINMSHFTLISNIITILNWQNNKKQNKTNRTKNNKKQWRGVEHETYICDPLHYTTEAHNSIVYYRVYMV